MTAIENETRETGAETALGPLDLEAYLARIAYQGSRAATLEVLHALHRAHAFAIPFEAIDVWAGDGVSLDPAAIDAKIIGRRRGYCFEQNGLFRRALVSLGFRVAPRIARVFWGEDGSGSAPRTHMALEVAVNDESRLVDVGFGAAAPLQPLRLHTEEAQSTDFGTYRVVATSFGQRLEVDLGGVWRPLYEVFSEPPLDQDFEVANWFTSRHPSSTFLQNLVVARPTLAGRWSLSGADLTFRPVSGVSRKHRLGAGELQTALSDIFGLTVEAHWQARLQELAARPHAT